MLLGEPVSMLVPQVVGFRLSASSPRGRRRRPRPRRHPDPQEPRRGREVRGVLRPRARRAPARRPRHHREHVAGVGDVRGSSPWTRRRSATCASRAAAQARSSSWRRTAACRASSTTPTRRPSTRRSSSSTSATSSRASRGRAGRRTACRSPRRRRPSSTRSRASASPTGTARRTRRSPTRSPRATRRTSRSRARARSRRRARGARRRCRGARAAVGPRLHGRRVLRAGARLRRHRRDHELHEHLQPVGDGRRRAARQERRRAGLARKPWVKSSLAPGSKVVTEYYDKAGLTPFLEALGFHTVGYGCTTCIGNSGPLAPEISRRSRRASSSSAPSSPGTATSRRASIPR